MPSGPPNVELTNQGSSHFKYISDPIHVFNQANVNPSEVPTNYNSKYTNDCSMLPFYPFSYWNFNYAAQTPSMHCGQYYEYNSFNSSMYPPAYSKFPVSHMTNPVYPNQSLIDLSIATSQANFMPNHWTAGNVPDNSYSKSSQGTQQNNPANPIYPYLSYENSQSNQHYSNQTTTHSSFSVQPPSGQSYVAGRTCGRRSTLQSDDTENVLASRATCSMEPHQTTHVPLQCPLTAQQMIHSSPEIAPLQAPEELQSYSLHDLHVDTMHTEAPQENQLIPNVNTSVCPITFDSDYKTSCSKAPTAFLSNPTFGPHSLIDFTPDIFFQAIKNPLNTPEFSQCSAVDSPTQNQEIVLGLQYDCSKNTPLKSTADEETWLMAETRNTQRVPDFHDEPHELYLDFLVS